MDREIEFRGKDLFKDRWYYGYYLEHKRYLQNYIIDLDEECMCKQHLINKETLGQYTGLKDKNGKKIFEGDILYLKTGKGWTCGEGVDVYYKVIFTQFNEECRSTTEYIGYMAEDKDGNLYSIEYIVRVDGAEVIGNIWDNPELLEDNND